MRTVQKPSREGKGEARPYTSADMPWIMDLAERRWFASALRARIDDSQRLDWKHRFIGRAVTLLCFWHRAARRS